MLFFFPMWDSESQRLGKRKCTPVGYGLHIAAELIGFIALLLLIGMIGFLWYKWYKDAFYTYLFWLPVIPLGIGITAEGLYQLSWILAEMKEFEYNGETREASWMEAGERVTYKWQPDTPPGDQGYPPPGEG